MWIKRMAVMGLVLCLAVCTSLSPVMAAPEAENNTVLKKESKEPAASPTGAWVLEGVGGIVVVAGFVILALGQSSIIQRNQKYKEFEDQAKDTSAAEIKELEDNGIVLSYTGYAVGGVGLVLMGIGVIWMLTHDPAPNNKEVKALGAVSPSTSNTTSAVLVRQSF